MQTTLLGFAIAIILALVTALVGPLFVDWGRFRGEFEARASRLTGLEFKVAGPIDARLLPTPRLVLQDLEFGRFGEATKVRARALRLEFALGSFARGEWKITDARLEDPELDVALDDAGRVALPVPAIGFDLDAVSIQRLAIENGRASFAHAASGSKLVLDKIEFKGEVRSLAGPIKGEGAFLVGGQHYPYRIATSRAGEDGGVKVRLSIDPIDRPVTTEADVSFWIERGVPRFEGTLAFARSVGRAAQGTQALIIEPWRVTSRVKGDGAAAVLEQIELQYGPDERPIKLRGDARFTFGAQPQIEGAFSSPQIDLDRLLALPEPARRSPRIAIKSLAENLSAAHSLPFPLRLAISAESVTLAGAPLQRVRADVKSDAQSFDIEVLELRAPGITQMRLAGRLGVTPKGVAFSGPVRIESSDPRAFVAWLADRSDVAFTTSGALRMGGDVKLSGEAIAVEALKLELDRMAVSGALAYSWARDDRPARLDASLTAPEIDLDRVQALAKAFLGDTDFDWPHEGTIALKIDRALLAGIDAKQTAVDVRIDANGYGIERLTIADFGGASVAVKGRIDNHKQTPRGEITLDLDARALDGITTLLEKFSPAAADQLRSSAARFAPLKLRAQLSVDPGTPDTGAKLTHSKFQVNGSAGAFRVALAGEAGSPVEAFAAGNLARLGATKVNFSGRVEVNDSTALVDLAGLDRLLAVEKRPGRLVLNAKGALDGEIAVDSQLAAGALTLAAAGTVRGGGAQPASASLDLKIANARLRSLRPAGSGKAAELLPMSATAKLALANGTVTLSDLAGNIAGTSIGGRLTISARKPASVAGEIALDALDLPAVLAAALGTPAPAQAGRSAALWPSEPFEAGLPQWIGGRVAFTSALVALSPRMSARDVRGSLQFSGSELALQDLDGAIAGGRIGGELAFARRGDEMSARVHIKVSGADIADLLPADGALAGRLSLDVSASGSGMSPVALVGSLGGSGTFKLENAQIARLDPRAFDAVIRAVDQGLPIETARIRARTEAALAAGSFPIASAEGAITINSGQARLSNAVIRTENADLAVTGNFNSADAALDARLTLTAAVPGAGGASTGRPEIVVALKGAFESAKRTIDVTALASWLALRAVEQQSQKLDALEGAPPAPAAPTGAAPSEQIPPAAPPRVAPQPLPPASDVSPPAVPVPVPPPAASAAPAKPNSSAPAAKPPAAAAAAVQTEQEANPPDVAKPAPPRQAPRARPKPPPKPRTATAPAEQQQQPLDLRPAPNPRVQNNNGWPNLFRLFQQ